MWVDVVGTAVPDGGLHGRTASTPCHEQSRRRMLGQPCCWRRGRMRSAGSHPALPLRRRVRQPRAARSDSRNLILLLSLGAVPAGPCLFPSALRWEVLLLRALHPRARTILVWITDRCDDTVAFLRATCGASTVALFRDGEVPDRIATRCADGPRPLSGRFRHLSGRSAECSSGTGTPLRSPKELIGPRRPPASS